jgi:hypothetical protein
MADDLKSDRVAYLVEGLGDVNASRSHRERALSSYTP